MNTTRNALRAMVVLLWGTTSLVLGQETTSLADGVRRDVSASDDPAWKQLVEASRPRSLSVPSGASAEDIGRARSDLAQAYVEQADRLKEFYQLNPQHAQAKEAKRLEALNLLYAAWAGDSSQRVRRGALVAEIRSDASLSQDARGEVAAYAENLKVSRQAGLAGDERMAAFERVVRGLIAEFPEAAAGYESLLRIGKHRGGSHASRVAADLLSMPAPDWVKQEAKALMGATNE